jgi:hypothetical protein
MMLLCFVHTSCSSAANCWTTKLTDYWQEGSTSVAISPSFAPNVVGKQSKVRSTAFRAPFVYTTEGLVHVFDRQWCPVQYMLRQLRVYFMAQLHCMQMPLTASTSEDRDKGNLCNI